MSMFWRRSRTKEIKEACPVKDIRNLRAIAITDVGAVRKNNEDQVRFVRPSDLIQRKEKGFLAVVADGMGGHAAGERASTIAVNTLCRAYYDGPSNPLQALRLALSKANEAIFHESRSDLNLRGMGTTCTAAAIIDDEIFIGHVGDSRAYLVTSDEIYQLTEDHTYVQELLRKGEIDPLEAINHSQKHVLTQALGTTTDKRGDVFLSKLTLSNSDKLLLCTDGFYEYFTDEEIRNTLLSSTMHDAGKILLQQAIDRGGHDNISFLLVEVEMGSSESSAPTEFLNS